jgi:hypothetical protein
MTAADLLAAARQRGIELRTEGSRFRFRGPRGAMTDDLRQAIDCHRNELLTLLADRALSEVLALVAQARFDAKQRAQDAVLAEYVSVARRYHADGDPLLYEAAAAVQGLRDRWRDADAGCREAGDWIPDSLTPIARDHGDHAGSNDSAGEATEIGPQPRPGG